eukprot:scaffold710_cov171-Amphora_coffeaeformis.AAC.49
MEKAASARKKLAASMQQTKDVNESFDLYGKSDDYNGALPPAETSYLSSSSSSNSGDDALNQSVLSDTTELTASNFVFSAAARQRWSIGGNRREILLAKQENAKENQAKAAELLQDARPPLTTTLPNKKNDRRNTLAPGAFTRPTTLSVAQKQPQRRDSWQGDSPASESVKDKAMGFLAVMKERRLSRQSTGSRLSLGSLGSKKDDADDTSRVSLSSLFSKKEDAGSRQSTGSRLSIGTLGSKKDGAGDTSRVSLGSLFSKKEDTGDTTTSIGISKDLMQSFSESAPESPSKMNRSAASDDDSIVSVGSLFDDLIPTGKSGEATVSNGADFTLRPSLASELITVANNASAKTDAPMIENDATDQKMSDLPEDDLSTSSAMVDYSLIESKSEATEEAVGFSSQISQIGTPVEAPSPAATSPLPLPETVVFESDKSTSESSQSATTSPFRSSKSPQLFGLTRRLTQSPGRSIDSPAGNTRSSKSPAKSPAKSSEKKKRKLDQSIEMADDDDSAVKRGRKSSVASVALNSSFRKASSRQHGSARKVAFGSPDVVEFHTTSPSMSMTPMPKNSAKSRFSIPDDTVEIEADMNALFNTLHTGNQEDVDKLSAVNTSTSTAGSTPFATRRGTGKEVEDVTRELEMNLEEVLDKAEDTGEDDAESNMSDDSQAGDLVGEHTQALEISMNEVLVNAIGADSNRSQQSIPEGVEEEEDRTVELEVDMGALLMAADTPEQSKEKLVLDIEMADDTTPVAGQRLRRSSIASRRFSLEPKSRLSLDGPYPEETEHFENEVVAGPVVEKKDPVLEIEVHEILSVAKTRASSSATIPDVFAETSAFLRNNPSALLAEALNTFLREVCEHVETTSIPEIDSDFISQLPETEQARVLALQECLRSENKEVTEVQLGLLMEVSSQCEGITWQKWILDTAVQMEEYMAGHTDELRAERDRVAQEIQRVDDAECLLSSMKARAVQKARRKSLERRKVCWQEDCVLFERVSYRYSHQHHLSQLLQTSASALEMEIRRLEEEIEESASKLEAAKAKQLSVKHARAVATEREELTALLTAKLELADNTGKKWTMLKALTPFQFQILSNDSASLTYVGPYPGASVSVFLRMSNGKFESCSAKIDPTVYPKNKSRNSEKYKNVMELVSSRTKRVCEKLSTPTLAGADVGKVLRLASWELYRAKTTADEICKLQRRYDARIIATKMAGKTCAVFGLEVQFKKKGMHGAGKVAAHFELSELYPSCLLHMQLDVLEGDVDIDDVHANLVKTAKPGFGYLLRICNVIAASVQ